MQVLFRNQQINLTSLTQPESVDELQHILLKIDSYNVCTGGPNSNYYKNIQPECAVRENCTWRHKNCPLILEKGFSCKHCISLYKILSKCGLPKKKQKLKN